MWHLFRLLDNSTVAGLITVLAGGLFGGFVYRRQKDIDRRYSAEDKLIDTLLLLKEHCKGVNQYVDRLAYTLIRIYGEKDKDKQKDAYETFAKVSLPKEVTEASQILMYVLPEDISKIEGVVSFYFDDESVDTATQRVFDAFKKWHDTTQKYLMGETGTFNSRKRVAEIPELSLDDLDKEIKDLIKMFRNPRVAARRSTAETLEKC